MTEKNIKTPSVMSLFVASALMATLFAYLIDYKKTGDAYSFCVNSYDSSVSITEAAQDCGERTGFPPPEKHRWEDGVRVF